MKHHLFGVNGTGMYKVAVLCKATSFVKKDLISTYVAPLEVLGVPKEDVIAFTFAYNTAGKAPVTFIKEYLDALLPELKELGTEYLLVNDANYFKVLTKQAKAEIHLGYSLPCAIEGYTHMQVFLGINYQVLIYDPAATSKLERGLSALAASVAGTYEAPGGNIIHSALYPKTVDDIKLALESLHQYPELSADIEAFSLRFDEAGIGTIGFAWDEHNGVAFACDYYAEFLEDGYQVSKGVFKPYHKVRELIRNFLETYKGKLTWHSANYDLKVMIYTLWMQNYLDTTGLLKGLEVVTGNFDDTKIIAYLATNSTAGNELGLKPLAQAFAGNWAKDEIKDIRNIPLDELLEYNLVDCLSTNYVKNKYLPIMVADKQLDLYNNLMLPSVKLLLQTELTGMPMSKAKITQIRVKLEAMLEEHLAVIRGNKMIAVMDLLVQTSMMEVANAKLKTKQHPIEKYAHEKFNPNSGPQLQRLLYELMGLPVIDFTDTKQPATGADTLEKLIHHTDEPSYKEVLSALIGYGKVTKILSTFIPAFERGIDKAKDGIIWLHGNFNIGGTVSGRLSSSDPNLQNIPANSIFGKLIKECFVSPTGWIFAGADFNALEARVGALLTKDSAKLCVYTDGYDSHSFNAYGYWKEKMPDIVLTGDPTVDVGLINSIATHPTYKPYRQASKAITFAAQYGGTYRTFMNSGGFSEQEAKDIEANYHKLYFQSGLWAKALMEQACKDGYVTGAFGLRIRTPLLSQVILGGRNTPFAAEAEARTATNGAQQGYGLLNNRAAIEFMDKVWKSEHRLNILPVAFIHDSIYLIIKDNIDVVNWANKELVTSMEWQELPELQHPIVKLGANLELYWPHWGNPLVLPNNATKEEIIAITEKGKSDYAKKM